MSSILTTETAEIGGRLFTIRVLPFSKARQVYARLQKIIMALADEDLSKIDGRLFLAMLSGGISDEDQAFYAKEFGGLTSVDMGDGRVLTLSNDKALDELFSGRMEDYVSWLEACIDVNFRGSLEKMRAAVTAVAGKQAAKAQPKA